MLGVGVGVFMRSAETLDRNARASNVSLPSRFICTSITEQSEPGSLHGGEAAQAFMAEHICCVQWGNPDSSAGPERVRTGGSGGGLQPGDENQSPGIAPNANHT